MPVDDETPPGNVTRLNPDESTIRRLRANYRDTETASPPAPRLLKIRGGDDTADDDTAVVACLHAWLTGEHRAAVEAAVSSPSALARARMYGLGEVLAYLYALSGARFGVSADDVIATHRAVAATITESVLAERRAPRRLASVEVGKDGDR